MVARDEISEWFQSLQDRICADLENLDGHSRFKEDLWNRSEGGGGRTRVIENGHLIEKGGVNFSAVHGPTPENIIKALKLSNSDFFATGVSIVIHPTSPCVPIIHMNVRYFEMTSGEYWFGGGIDLTPHYIDPDLAKKFHLGLKKTCDKHSEGYYPKFKEWADDYFYIKHRKETRGIGGIFFDRLSEGDGKTKSDIWNFVKSVGDSFVPLYSAQAYHTRNLEYSESHKKWQSLRRGRYVEFNLVWDKGTKFGLDTNGRTESILMSMPPVANWEYNFNPIISSEEQRTSNFLKKGIDWVNYD